MISDRDANANVHVSETIITRGLLVCSCDTEANISN